MSVAFAVASPGYAATLTRTSGFVYDATSGLLTKEIVEPDDGTLCLVTEYGYDAYGNKTSATTRNCNGSSGEAAAPTGDAVIASRSSGSSYAAGSGWSAGQFATGASNALGQSESRSYDARFGAVLTLTGPNGLSTQWQVDDFGRKTREIRADGTQTKWDYLYCTGVNSGSATCPTVGGAAGAWVLVATPLASDGVTQNGPIAKVYYDALNREIRKETQGFDGTGSSTPVYQDTRYDSLGRAYQKSRPYYSGQTAYWTTLAYDGVGRVVSETRPDTTVTSTAYNGLTVTVTNARSQTRTTVKNSQGQVVSVTDTNSQTLTFAYDPFGNLVQTTDPLGNVTTLTYDLRGRKTQMQDPDMGTWTYAYDALGQLIRQTDAKAQVSQMSYDLLGRMTQRAEADLVSAWYYDTYKGGGACTKGIGKLCQAETSTGYNRTHSYDSLGRPVGTATTLDQVYGDAATYDAQGRLATRTTPAGVVVKYGYTALGYLKDLRDNASNALYWQADSQDAEGHLLSQTYGNGVQTQQTYQATTGRLTGLLAGAGNAVQNFSYQYDALGNLTSRTDGNQSLTESFLYDSLNRLTSSTVNSSGAGIVTKTYAYDVLGNLTSRSDLGTYTYPASGAASVRPHALSQVTLSAGGYRTYAYDANGNLTTEAQYDATSTLIPGKGRTEVYTSFNMPQAMGSPSISSAFYYGPEHQRVKQISSSQGTTYYLNPGNNGDLFYEKDYRIDGSIEQRSFLTAYGTVVAVVKAITTTGTTQQVRYFHRDGLGSTTIVTDETGFVVERLAYEPFGRRRFANGADDPNNTIAPLTTDRGFTNHEHIDELTLVHMNGRIYDPVVGRFMSADPVIPNPNDLQSYNRYSYVHNNPLAFTDPDGHCEFVCIMLWIVGTAEVAHQLDIIDTSTARTIQGLAIGALIGSPTGAEWFGISGATQTIVAGAAAGFVSSNFSVEGALMGGVSAGLFYGVGSLTEMHTASSKDFLTPKHLANIAGHAAIGCAMAAARGGKCEEGAMSGAVGSFVTPIVPQGTPGLIITTVAGGTASVLGGGKFANGAVTSGFGYLFNECAQGGCSGKAETESKPWGSYLPGTKAGENAAQYWADLQVQTGNPLYAVPGSFASLWTPDTAVATGLTLGAAGTVAIAERAGLLWMRPYPNAGGEGLGIDWGGKNVIRFDWHRFKVDGVTVSRPHIDSKPLGLKHWPW